SWAPTASGDYLPPAMVPDDRLRVLARFHGSPLTRATLRPNDRVHPGDDLALGQTVDRHELGDGIVESLGAGLDPRCECPPCCLEMLHQAVARRYPIVPGR